MKLGVGRYHHNRRQGPAWQIQNLTHKSLDTAFPFLSCILFANGAKEAALTSAMGCCIALKSYIRGRKTLLGDVMQSYGPMVG